MKVKRTFGRIMLIGLVGTMSFGACSSNSSAPNPSPTTAASTSSPTSGAQPSTAQTTSEPTPKKDGHAACAMIMEPKPGDDSIDSTIFMRIPTTIYSIGAKITNEQQTEMLVIYKTLNDASEIAPQPLSSNIQALNRPFAQFVASMENGGESLKMDTSHLVEDASTVTKNCIDLGYKRAN